MKVFKTGRGIRRKKMVYNFNLGIGWASSGVEYAQAYRAKVFREIGQEARDRKSVV